MKEDINQKHMRESRGKEQGKMKKRLI